MSLTEATQFVEQGSLEKPLIIGRLVRFVLGVAALYFIYMITPSLPAILEYGMPGNDIAFWIVTALAFWMIPPVMNIGFSLNTRSLSRWVIGGVSLVLGAYYYFTTGVVFGYALSIFTVGWVYYLYAHLGPSLVLAALLATPGCEMRSIPHLYTIVTGRDTKEHYCPGALDGLDRWERERQAA